MNQPQVPQAWNPQGPQEAPTIGLGSASISSLLPIPFSGNLLQWRERPPGPNACILLQKTVSTWPQRKTSSDSWTLSTFPQSREMPDPINPTSALEMEGVI